MDIDTEKQAYTSWNRTVQLRFVTELAAKATIHAREYYAAATEAAAVDGLRATNELIHSLAFHALHLVDETDAAKRYPDDVFVDIVVEKAAQCGFDSAVFNLFAIRR